MLATRKQQSVSHFVVQRYEKDKNLVRIAKGFSWKDRAVENLIQKLTISLTFISTL